MLTRTLTGTVLLFCLVAVSTGAQEQNCAIEGSVLDPSGRAVSGAEVRVKRTTGFDAAARTMENGRFLLPSLPPGEYTVVAKLGPYSSAAVGIRATVGTRRDITLRLSPVAHEEVNVTATAKNVTLSESATFEREDFINLPLTTDFTSIIRFAGGTTDDVRTRGLGVHGATAAENRFTVDGLDVTEPLNGGSGIAVHPEFVEALQVRLAGYEAEYGGATGGVINTITRSGSNDIRGSVNISMAHTDWSGDVRPQLSINTNGAAFGTYSTPSRDPRSLTDAAATISGPVVRDRAWFFLGYRPTAEETRRRVTFGDLSTGEFEQTRERHQLLLNLSHAVTRHLQLRWSSDAAFQESEGLLPPLNGVASSDQRMYRAIRNENTVSTHSLNAEYFGERGVALSLSAGRYSTTLNVSGVPDEPRHYFETSNATLIGIPPALVRPAGYYNNPTNYATRFDDFTRDYLSLDATLAESAFGLHEIKGGAQLDRVRNDVDTGMLQPAYTFFWGQPYDGSGLGAFGWMAAEVDVERGSVKSTNDALFLQNRWSAPGGRLIVNAGLRAENERIPSYADDRLRLPDTAIEFDYSQKLAPRFAALYDIRGDGAWTVSGTYGTFFDRMKLNLPRQAFGGRRDIYYFFYLDTFDWQNLKCTGLNGLPTDVPSCNGATFIELTNAFPASNDPSRGGVAANLRPVESREWTLATRHVINARANVTLRYVHKEIVRTVDTVAVGAFTAPVNRRLVIANPGFGVAKYPLPNYPELPRPVREYDAAELELTARPSNALSLHASYIYSRLWGNYSGIFTTDDLHASGAYSGSFANALSNLYDANARPVYGRLTTDRPHQLKVQASWQHLTGIRGGVHQYVASGTPVSTQMQFRFTPFFPEGRGDLGRTPTLTQTDLFLAYAPRFLGSNVEISAQVLNVFDEDTEIARYTLYRSRTLDRAAGLNESTFFAGAFDWDAYKAANPPEAHFGKTSAFQASREIRASIKINF